MRIRQKNVRERIAIYTHTDRQTPVNYTISSGSGAKKQRIITSTINQQTYTLSAQVHGAKFKFINNLKP